MIQSAAIRINRVKNSLLYAALLLFFSACSVKDYPVNRPFVYDAEVHIVGGDVDKDDRKDLESRLHQQLHDSIAVRRVSKFFFSQLKNPPLYDSANADKSKEFMDALLHSLGYYRDSIRYDAKVVQKGDQLRTTVRFFVDADKLFTIDSISVALNDTVLNSPRQSAALDTLQELTIRSLTTSEIKRGAPFAKPLLSNELDRLTSTYRNNGFLRMTREDLRVLWDTVGIGLLRPTVDPIEQAQLLEALQRRREHPVADIGFRLRPITDSSRLTRYHIGKVSIYPDLTAENSKLPPPIVDQYRGVYIHRYEDLFKYRILVENIYLKPGQLYDQRIQQKTVNRFNSITAWRTANIEAVPRPGTDSVDMVIRLSPARKYGFDFNIEGSQNLGGLFIGSNLVGINLNLQNRNFAHRAVQATYSVGVATELNSTVTQTTQLSGGMSLIFPRFVPGFRIPKRWREANPRTSIGINARYIHRVDYLDLVGVNASWGYDFSFPHWLVAVRLPNVEYNSVQRRSILDSIIKNNQSYKYIFNDGLVVSTIISATHSRVKTRTTSILRLGTEISGLLLGMGKSIFLDTTLKRFFKFDASYSQNRKLGQNNSVLAWRVLGGIGYSYPGANESRRFMPFFKAYFAGGANSMRGWSLRKLGPGSAIRSFARDSLPERFGDMQLEANIEYRFLVANVRGVYINSALFADFGNIWYLRENPVFPNGNFAFNRLWQDIAIDVGTGLRVDFGFIKFRLDYAFKAKDPSPEDPLLQNKPFPNFKLLGGTAQLGVDYPF
jgi:outer membrane protein insertion porin family